MTSVFFKLFIFSVLAGAVLAIPASASANAPIDPGYNNRIIDDAIFTNAGTMSQQDIQNFLNSKVPACDTNHQGGLSQYPPPYTCLKNYVDPLVNKPAAQIIYEESQRVGLNPQVILTTLQKEQSLVTDTWPYPSQYRTAMGYGCPDSSPGVCNSAYYGLYNQIHLAATLLRAGYDRDCGNMSSFPGWYINPQWQRGGSPGVDNVSTYLSNCSTGSLYNYTPHRPDSAYIANDGNYYYGNYNFIQFFNTWFGNTLLPSLVSGPNGGTVYLNANGYKFVIPQMAMLQDYGYDPASITPVSQATLDAIPVPDSASGLSQSLGYVVKSPSDQDQDGGAAYLVSVGKRYTIQSMQQLSDYGINQANIVYLPLNYILGMQSGGNLSNFAYSPSHSTFKIAGGQKQLILDYQTYRSLNPGDMATPLSYYLTSSLSSGTPISNTDVLVRNAAGAIYLFNNGAYHLLSSIDIYNCWGFGAAQPTALFQLYDDAYVSPISNTSTLTSCIVNNGSAPDTLLNKVNKLTVPSAYAILGSQALSPDLFSIADRLSTYSSPLSQAIKSTASSAVWYIEGGVRRLIPTYKDFMYLGLDAAQVDVLDPSAVSAIPSSGIKLGTGTLAKSSNSSSVYIINGNARSLFASADDFLGYRNDWSDIDTLDAHDLDQLYPYSGSIVNRYLFDQTSGSGYLVDINGCYSMTAGLLSDYGENLSALRSSQAYNSTIFRKLILASCDTGSNYVKAADQPTVYWVKNNTKYPFSSWESLQRQAGGTPPVIKVSASTLQPIPSGDPIQ